MRRIFFPFQTANVVKEKSNYPDFSAYPDGSTSKLLRIIGVLLYLYFSFKQSKKVLLLDYGIMMLRRLYVNYQLDALIIIYS